MHGFLWPQEHFAAIGGRSEGDAVLGDFAPVRQREHLEAAGIGEDGLAPARKPMPVSYTHLDVYKRQDYASDVDEQAEQAVIKELRRAYPDAAFLGEEGGVQGKKGGSLFVIDPLDGTSNYLHGIPHWCVSIALVENGEPQHAVIFDPLRNELFTASKGSGTVLNDLSLIHI